MGIPAPLGVSAPGLPPKGDQANAVLFGVIAGVGPTAPLAIRGPLNLALFNSFVTALTTAAASLNVSVASATGIAAGTAINSANVPRGATFASINAGAKTGVLALPPVTLMASDLSTASPRVTLPPGSNVNALLGAIVTVPSNAEGVTLPAGTTVAAIVQADIAPTLISAGQPGIVQLSNNPTAIPSISTTASPQPLQFAPTGNAISVTGADAAASFSDAAAVCAATVQLERSFDGGATWIACNIGGTGVIAQWSNFSAVQIVFGEPEKEVLYRLNCLAYVSGTINYRISTTGAAAESLAIGTSI